MNVDGMNIAYVAAPPTLHQPHTLIFFIATLACLLVAVIWSLSNRDISWQRRRYWRAVAAASFCVFVAALPDWRTGLVVFCLAWLLMVFGAYICTPYIKIRGKIYAYYVVDSLPDPPPDGSPRPGTDAPDYDPAPDSYGGLATAQKSWWLGIFAMGICSANVFLYVVHRSDLWKAILFALVVVLLAALLGYGDASWGYPIARGQKTQLVIMAVVTAGVFTVLYLAGYSAGKRWPLRRTQSMEYRAHPRYWKKAP